MTELALHTRGQSQIENFHLSDAPSNGEREQAEAWKRRHDRAVHRPTPVCYTYNCHGLTFAARRTEIWSSSQVRKILSEDDYDMIGCINEVLPGDIVIYIDEHGDICHSGIVIENAADLLVRNPKILSKWGCAHEVIHFVKDCPYNQSNVEYYRVGK